MEFSNFFLIYLDCTSVMNSNFWNSHILRAHETDLLQHAMNVSVYYITLHISIVIKYKFFSQIFLFSEFKKLYSTGPVAVTKSSPLNGYLHFPNAFPVLQLAVTLPDFRFRMYRRNMIQGIASDLVLYFFF